MGGQGADFLKIKKSFRYNHSLVTAAHNPTINLPNKGNLLLRCVLTLLVRKHSFLRKKDPNAIWFPVLKSVLSQHTQTHTVNEGRRKNLHLLFTVQPNLSSSFNAYLPFNMRNSIVRIRISATISQNPRNQSCVWLIANASCKYLWINNYKTDGETLKMPT